MDIKNQYLISKSWIAFLRESPWFQFRECWKSRCKLLGLQAAFLQNGSGGPGRREGDEVLVVAFTFQSHLWRGKMIAGSGEVSMAGEDVQVTSCRYLCWILGRCQCHLNLNPSYRSKKNTIFTSSKVADFFLRFEKKSVESNSKNPPANDCWNPFVSRPWWDCLQWPARDENGDRVYYYIVISPR